MANLLELKKQHRAAIDRADNLVRQAEIAGRILNANEQSVVDGILDVEIPSLAAQIKSIESRNTMSTAFPSLARNGTLLIDAPHGAKGERINPRRFSAQYGRDLMVMIQSNGRKVSESLLEVQDSIGGFPLAGLSAALYEGSNTGGGYAVPVVVDDQIVPLAAKEMAVRRLATVIPTTSDIKMPVKESFGVATAKAETSAFVESDLTIGQFTLSAFMSGNQQNVSWELAQDVPAFQASVVDDLVIGQQVYEENLYINGTGSGQAQGLIGNVGAGITDEPDTNGNLVSINATLDVMGQLNAQYWPGASWLMARPTSIIIRKAQMQSNLFFPAFTSVNGQDYLHGHPVFYSASMPLAARGATPVLFGDFKRGYIIGDRGGSGINVKVLDQPLATSGLIVLLAYRRTDGRVRRSEAVQSLTIASS
jgi:HK97 family phage major capsid protein